MDIFRSLSATLLALIQSTYTLNKYMNNTRIEPVGKPYREVCLQTLEGSSTQFFVALPFRNGTQIERIFFVFFFLFLNCLFWVVLNILSTNELTFFF